MTKDIELARATPSDITQATAVEQARARAEVEAAVYVAQKMPRDMARAEAEMRDACGRLALASKAFYSVPNRGNGPSVHLAREIVRIWGNVDYGVHELRRDDTAGMSEVRAFAWDQQTNVRSTRTFQVPHQRMAKGKRQPLIDLGDVYLNNQNVGARAVRECVFTVLPAWYRELAIDLCRATLKNGEGVPLSERIASAVKGFGGIDVTVEQLEQRVGRKRGQWTADDVVQLGITFRSIEAGDVQKDEEFPPVRVTAAEIAGQQPPAGDPAPADPAPDGYDDAEWLAGGKPETGGA